METHLGVLYVAYGDKAGNEARLSINSLQNHHPWPVAHIGTKQIKGSRLLFNEDPTTGTPGRWAKVNLDRFSPFDLTLFLDADTRIYGNLQIGFDALKLGWDMVMVASRPQGHELFDHLSESERVCRLSELPPDPLQFNTGVIWFRKSERVKRLFYHWRLEWDRWRDKDQGALLGALERSPVRLLLLGWPFNGGAVIGHRFGACR